MRLRIVEEGGDKEKKRRKRGMRDTVTNTRILRKRKRRNTSRKLKKK